MEISYDMIYRVPLEIRKLTGVTRIVEGDAACINNARARRVIIYMHTPPVNREEAGNLDVFLFKARCNDKQGMHSEISFEKARRVGFQGNNDSTSRGQTVSS